MRADTQPGDSRAGTAVRWWVRLLVRSVLLLPRCLTGLFLTLVGRTGQATTVVLRAADSTPDAHPVPAWPRLLWTQLLLIPMGILALLLAALATLDEIRVLFLYWWTDGSSISATTWGGPTLAGAWAVHALLGLLLFPVFTAAMAGLDALARRMLHRLRRPGPRWVLPATVVTDLAASAFLVAFVRQL